MTWEEILASRIEMPSLRNSAHMLQCWKKVLAKYPTAQIVAAGTNLWKLEADGKDLSNPHNSHYECWLEARLIMERVS